MRTALKNVLCGLYRYSGLLTAQEMLHHWRGQSSASILLFHRVTDEIPADGLTVSCARFRALCHMLALRFRVVPLAEVFRLARSGAALPRRTLAITFDDCYRDNLAAARVLAEYGLAATFFVPTAYVGTNHVFSWDRCHKPLPNLSWQDVDEMHQLGFEIGSHTVTHPDLGRVSAQQAEREFVESKDVLERQLGSRVRWLAYPFGGVNNFRIEWLPLLQRVGYDGCVSAYGGLIYSGMETAVLPRVPVPSFANNLQLEMHLSGCLSGYYALKRRLGLSELRLASWEQAHGASAEMAVFGERGASAPCSLSTGG